MSESFRCCGKVGTVEVICMYFDDAYVPPDGSVEMTSSYPITRPERFGDWYVTAEGGYIWVTYPDPPFNVVYHEGKLKNSDTMVEISIDNLPGNIAARLAELEILLPLQVPSP